MQRDYGVPSIDSYQNHFRLDFFHQFRLYFDRSDG